MDMNFQTVFSNAVEDETTFDTIFGAEEDDELIANVLGESGDEEDMDTLDTGISASELEKELSSEESDAPKVDPSDEVETPDKTDSEKDAPGENIACPCSGVEDAVEKREPEEDNLEDEIDKAEKKSDIDDLEEAFGFDNLFSEDGGESDDADDDDDDDDFEDSDDTEIAGDAGVELDDDDDDLDDLDNACESEDMDFDTTAPSTNITGQEEENKDNKTSTEEAFFGDDFDSIFSESDDMGTADEKAEDEIIDTVEDDSEMTDAEVEALDTEDDDELIDEILGED